MPEKVSAFYQLKLMTVLCTCMVMYEHGTSKPLNYRATEYAISEEVDQQLYNNSFISHRNRLYLGGKEN